MSEVDPQVAKTIEAFALPQPAERLRVREVVLARLGRSAASLTELASAVYDDAVFRRLFFNEH